MRFLKNYKLFDETLLDNWADRDGLTLEEKFLFEQYLFPLNKNIKVLDIGAGNGRFLFELAKIGFTDLHGIDLAENLLAIAKERASKEFPFVKFYKMDASNLTFDENTFDVVIALQQVISLIEEKQDRMKMISECYRVLKSKGILIISCLHYSGRWFNPLVSLLSTPIKIIKGEQNFLSYQYLPWLSLNNKINFKFLWNKQPYLYWFKTFEFLKILEFAGFDIIDVKTSKMIRRGIDNYKPGGMLYVVAKKPRA